MKTAVSGIVACVLCFLLVGCGSPTIGGQFAEPQYGWQRNGTYILTPTEMEMECDALVVEQAKAAKAIAYVNDVRGQKFGESLVITGIAAAFGLMRLPDVGFEERKAKVQLVQGAEAFNVRLVELGCEPSDINALIAEEAGKFREAQREAEAAARETEASVASATTTFNVGTKSDG